MNLLLVGVNHQSAPVEVREQLAIPEQSLGNAVRLLVSEPGVSEGMIVSTCNRVEVLAETAGDVDLCGFLGRLHGRDLTRLRQHLYERRERDALRHVFRVTSSLDSLVVGEPQIFGQVKHAYHVARDAGAVRTTLEAVMSRAFAVAKKVRTETNIGRSASSISHAAVDLALQIFGSLHGKCVLLLGAGKMGQLAARCLIEQGAGPLLIANRTFDRAQAVAATYNAEPLSLAEIPARGHRADIIISSTGSSEYLLYRSQVAEFLARRRQRPILLLDIAVPRDIDPQVQTIENAFLYNIDDLQAVVDASMADRQREAMRAEAMIETEVESFLQRLGTLDVIPTLRAIQKRADQLRTEELARVRSRLGPLTPEQERAVDAMTRSLMQKWLHRPLVELKQIANEATGFAAMDLIHRLFGITDSAVGTDDEDEK